MAQWLKQKHFDFGNLLIVSALKPFHFSLCLPFFFLLRKKVEGRGGACPLVSSGVACSVNIPQLSLNISQYALMPLSMPENILF